MSVDAGLQRLADRFGLGARAVEQLDRLLASAEADPHAPTAVRQRGKALDVHLADSLMALEIERLPSAGRAADLGSGAGFPGLVLAVARPALAMSLVESSSRKCRYLEEVVGRARVENARVVYRRAEAWNEGRETCRLVTARALAPLPVVVEYAAPLLEAGGLLVAWAGIRDSQTELDAKMAAATLGLEPHEIRPVSPYRASRHRHLHVFAKTGSTPERFPRRPGVARKRPLRAGSEDVT